MQVEAFIVIYCGRSFPASCTSKCVSCVTSDIVTPVSTLQW